jgi:uncharacterized protein YciI
MKNTYLVISKAGPKRDLTKGSREQQFWDEHATFIDGLVDDGFIMMGGPFDDGGAMLIVHAENEQAVRQTVDNDPWYAQDILLLDTIKRWDIFIDERR